MMILLLLPYYFVETQVPNHFIASHEEPELVKYYDVFPDTHPSLGGTGLVYVVGERNGFPLITAVNPDGTINWSIKVEQNGVAYAVTKRAGMYSQPDNRLFVGGVVYTPLPTSFLLVMDALNGTLYASYTASSPGSELDEVRELIIGQGGDLYGIGRAFTGVNPSLPFNTMLFRFDPDNMSFIYSKAYTSGEIGVSLYAYQNYIYTVERAGNSIVVRMVDPLSGDDLTVVNITNPQSPLQPSDILVNDDAIFVSGGMVSSLFLSLYHNMSLRSVYSHTNTFWSDIEVGEDGKIYVWGYARRYIVYPNVSTRDFVLQWFVSNESGTQTNLERILIGGLEDDLGDGFYIRDYGYVSGYSKSFAVNTNLTMWTGVVGLISTNVSDMIWNPGCGQLENVTVYREEDLRYRNLKSSFIVKNASLGWTGLTPNPLHITTSELRLAECIANDFSHPVIIPEFQGIIMAATILSISILVKLMRKLTK